MPHYSPTDSPDHPRGVYYNAQNDSMNVRGSGSTYYHEVGHMIDHAATGYGEFFSNSPEFANALRADGQSVLDAYNQLSDDRKTQFLDRIRSDSAHSISDLLDATTGGKLHGRYGHTRDYWAHPGNLQAEAFAHFFEASMGQPEKRDALATLFPTSFGLFSSMLDSLMPNNPTRVLKRRI